MINSLDDKIKNICVYINTNICVFIMSILKKEIGISLSAYDCSKEC